MMTFEQETVRRGANIEYKKIKQFVNQDLFEEWFASEKKNWKKRAIQNYNSYYTENFVCQFARKKNYKCTMKLRVRLPQDNLSVIVEISEGHHDHSEVGRPTFTSQETGIVHTNIDLTPMVIQDKIQAMRRESGIANIAPPSLRQIKNAKYYKKKEKSIFSVEDLRQYAINKSAIPDDENLAFVVDFVSEINDENEQFCLVWTTKRLQKLQQKSLSIQADTTYKLTWHGFPVMVCGFSDAVHKYYGTYIAICSNENKWSYESFFRAVAKENYVPNVLMGDGDAKISAAARTIWSNIQRAMCYAHVTMNLNKKLPKKLLTETAEIRADVAMLQEASSKEEFLKASSVLNEEWNNRYTTKPTILKVCEYFFRQWVNSELNSWYEGYSPYVATNNGLESRNALMKKVTFRKKLALTEFLQMAENTLSNWSGRPEEQVPAILPAIPPFLYRNAFLMKQKNPFCKRITGEDTYVLCTREIDESKILEMYNLLIANDYTSWKAYKEYRRSILILTKSLYWPNVYSCSCTDGRKKRLCHHSVLLMCKLKILSYPPDASAKPLQRKRKLGRPRIAGSALSKE
ncbi:MULE transposase domain-containing protein [Ditylenchus destructor]|nr:MULE transposase domain-containing protein [Ditylenchus destructor]